ncbi:MAG: SurA N-terminal domain-containing protein, partial [Burkholderiaceae bacterium]|nr:SurA N-terminal domain-containing protein [Burkholderiaceae bacterium]
MFDFVRKHTRLFQFLLLILILPSFVALGVNGYTRFMDGSNAAVASVDGAKITRTELDAAVRVQGERLRAQSPNIDPKLLDSPEMRRQTLDQLVRERVIQAVAAQEHLTVTRERLNKVFWTDPQFAVLHGADGKINEAMFAAQGMSFEGFAQRLQRELVLRQVTEPVSESAVGGAAAADLAFNAYFQQREVQSQVFDAKAFASKAEPTDAQIEAYYKDSANALKFQLPESADIEYVELDLDALMPGITVSDKDLHDYYEQNAARFSTPEERRASHILIKVDKNASADDRAKAKARAEALLAEVRKAPATFADVARKNSQDEGSASHGGDLDFFGRGAMVKPFEDAVFAMKQGDISDVVPSDFGYHIIQLTGVRGGEKKSFDAVRGEIETEVKRQLAQKRYAELAEQFTNTVYEQADSFKPVIDKLKLKLQTATVQRQPAPTAVGPLASTKLLDAIFSADSLRTKRNTEAQETAPMQLLSARVVNYHPARQQPLADVKAQVREVLVQKMSAELAVKAGQERLQALQKSGDLTGLDAAELVSRAKPGKLPRKALDDVLRADVSKLPASVGVDAGNGQYVVVRINKVLPRDPALADAKKVEQQYAQAWSAAESAAYFSALKSSLKVNVKPQA